jgi:hypothetical protein
VDVLAAALELDADAQDAEQYESIGERFDDVLSEVLPFWDSHERALSTGFYFWDCWVDARNHDWQYYPGTERGDWPRLARAVAAALRIGEDPVGVPDRLLTRGPTWRQRLRTRFRGMRPGDRDAG